MAKINKYNTNKASRTESSSGGSYGLINGSCASTAGYAQNAGHASTADEATHASTADNLSSNSSDWKLIDSKDAAVLEKAKNDASQKYISKLYDDIVEGVINFLKTPQIAGKDITDYFLRKDQQDQSYNLLKLLGGIISDNLTSTDYVAGMDGHGFSLRNEEGRSVLEVDDIIVRRVFRAAVMEIQREMYTQGNLNLTKANGEVFRVVPCAADGTEIGITIFGIPQSDGTYIILATQTAEDGSTQVSVLGDSKGRLNDTIESAEAYKLYFTRTDGETSVYDQWRNGDLAKVQTLNVSSSADSDVEGNRYWYRTVLAHGIEALEDNQKYNYIIVSNTRRCTVDDTDMYDEATVSATVFGYDTTAENSIPTVGDKVIQKGSVLYAERSGVTTLAVDGEGNGGLIVYQGIGQNYRTVSSQFKETSVPVKITPNEVSITANSISIKTNSGGTKVVPVYMGEFIKGTSVANGGEQWLYEGALWLCLEDEVDWSPTGNDAWWELVSGTSKNMLEREEDAYVKTDSQGRILEGSRLYVDQVKCYGDQTFLDDTYYIGTRVNGGEWTYSKSRRVTLDLEVGDVLTSWESILSPEDGTGAEQLTYIDYYVHKIVRVSLVSQSTTYQVGTSGTTAPTGTWQTTLPSLPQGQYLWTRTIYTYSDDSTETNYNVSYQGVDSDNTVTGMDVLYIVTDDNTTEPSDDAGWSTNYSELEMLPNKYLWTATMVTWSSGAYNVVGKRLLGSCQDYADVTEVYALTTTTTAPSQSDDWSEVISPIQGRYVWTASRVTYADNTVEYVNIVCIGYMGENGADGQDGQDGADGLDGSDGQDGVDAYVASASINSLIITETRQSNTVVNYPDEARTINLYVTRGLTDVTSSASITSCSSDLVDLTYSGTTISVTALKTAYRWAASGNYSSNREGTIQATLSVGSSTVTFRLSVYVNRLGSAELKLQDDMWQLMATKQVTYTDENGDGHNVNFLSGISGDSGNIDIYATADDEGEKTASGMHFGSNGEVILDADKFEISNNGTAAALFEDGKLKAEYVDVAGAVMYGDRLYSHKMKVLGIDYENIGGATDSWYEVNDEQLVFFGHAEDETDNYICYVANQGLTYSGTAASAGVSGTITVSQVYTFTGTWLTGAAVYAKFVDDGYDVGSELHLVYYKNLQPYACLDFTYGRVSAIESVIQNPINSVCVVQAGDNTTLNLAHSRIVARGGDTEYYYPSQENHSIFLPQCDFCIGKEYIITVEDPSLYWDIKQIDNAAVFHSYEIATESIWVRMRGVKSCRIVALDRLANSIGGTIISGPMWFIYDVQTVTV